VIDSEADSRSNFEAGNQEKIAIFQHHSQVSFGLDDSADLYQVAMKR